MAATAAFKEAYSLIPSSIPWKITNTRSAHFAAKDWPRPDWPT